MVTDDSANCHQCYMSILYIVLRQQFFDGTTSEGRVVHDLKSSIRFLWNLGFFYSSLYSDVPLKRPTWDQRPEGHVLFCLVTGGFRPSPGELPAPGAYAVLGLPAPRVSGAGLSDGPSLVERGEVLGYRLCDWLTEGGPKSCWHFLLSLAFLS